MAQQAISVISLTPFAFTARLCGIDFLPLLFFPPQTEFMKRKVEGEGWDTQLGVWGRGVDPDLFSPARRCQDLRRQLGLGPNDVAALWLGRVVKEKQPGVWLRVRSDKKHDL